MSVMVGFQPISTVQATTYLTGNVSWDVYEYVSQDVVIQSGGTLTIETGTKVIMDCSDVGTAGSDSSRIEIIVKSGVPWWRMALRWLEMVTLQIIAGTALNLR